MGGQRLTSHGGNYLVEVFDLKTSFFMWCHGSKSSLYWSSFDLEHSVVLWHKELSLFFWAPYLIHGIVILAEGVTNVFMIILLAWIAKIDHCVINLIICLVERSKSWGM